MFLPIGRIVTGSVAQTVEFATQEDAAKLSPLAASLFTIPGVQLIFYGSNFISVTKDTKLHPGDEWPETLKSQVQSAIHD